MRIRLIGLLWKHQIIGWRGMHRMHSIGRWIATHQQLVLGNDGCDHSRLQLLARQVIVLQIAVFIAKWLAAVKRAIKNERNIRLRLQRVARVEHTAAALIACLHLIRLHDLRGIVC